MENFTIQIGLTEFSGPETLILFGLVLFLAFFTVYLALALIRYIFKRLYHNTSTFKHVVLSVKVPKYDVGEKGESPQPKNQQELAEKISIMETVFANIAGLPRQKGWKYFFIPRSDSMSFEIVLKEKLIYFYVVVAEDLKGFLESQITAQFPNAWVEEVEDYNIFDPQGIVTGAMLKFKKEYIYPIKTYRKLENDSLNAITNSLSKLEPGAGAAIQYIVRVANSNWHKWGQNTASEAHQGKKIKDAISDSQSGFSFKKLSKFFSGWFGFMGTPKKDDMAKPEKPYQLSSLEQETLKGIEEKAAKGGLEINIRIIVSADTEPKAAISLDNIVNCFAQFNIYEYGNAFKKYNPNKKKMISDFIFREFSEAGKMIVNTEEMTSLFHFPLGHTETPNIVWMQAKKGAPPAELPADGLLIGYNDYRNIYREIRLTDADRMRHVYVIGQTGTGKSVIQINMAIQDIANGKGICFIDPHADTIETIMQHIPKERAEDVIIFDPADIERPMGMNMLEFTRPEQKTMVINEMMGIFDKLYDLKATGGPIFEQYMRNALLLIMEDPESGCTLMEAPKVLSDAEFRKFKLSKTKTQVVKDFWLKEAEKAGGEAALQNVVPYITSKLTSFIANDIMRPIVAQQKSAFDFRQAMDERKIILVKLTKGLIGEINANLLGMVIIGKILLAALSRSDMPESERKDFFLYIDEFQNFLTEGIQQILSEARKYKLSLTVAHQFVGQLVKSNDTRIKDAVFGNVGTKIAFRVGVEDAEIFAKEFAPVFNQYDVMNQPNLHGYIKPIINGMTVAPFSFHTMPFENRGTPNPTLAKAISDLSRLKYGRDRNIVEAEIVARSKQTEAPEGEDKEDEEFNEDFFA